MDSDIEGLLMDKLRMGISSCLLGERVRYDGGHKWDRFITETFGTCCEWVPVCPEVEYGLPVPREAMHLVGEPEAPRLLTRRTGVDHTDGMLKWAARKVRELEKADLDGFLFKAKSPSSGMSRVKVYTSVGVPSHRGTGIFAREFMRAFSLVPVEDEGRFHDPALRENFIERVFAYRRWKDFLSGTGGGTLGGLVSFHTAHKLLVLSHGAATYRTLGRLVAGVKGKPGKEVFDEYAHTFMEGLKSIATNRKNANVLQHMLGYFRKRLSPDDRRELAEIIESYKLGLLPLIVPITLFSHYVRKFDEPYLKGQVYLRPYPAELMLRNHA